MVALPKEIAHLTEELARVKERNKASIQELEMGLARLRDSLARREREQAEAAELKKDLEEERNLREKELAELRNSLAGSISACGWCLAGRLANFTTLPLRNNLNNQPLISLKGMSLQNI